MKKKEKNILQLNNIQLKKYFLRSENYSNIDLPLYFNFDKLLGQIDKYLLGKELNSLIKPTELKNCENTNYKIINNKDGCYAWRQFQLINPILYVNLVNIISDTDNWSALKQRFLKFQENPKIKCASIPVLKKRNKQKVRAEQICNWWLEIEQGSLELIMDFDYCFSTDISDCYGSIYTHSITWAIMGKYEAKKDKNNKKKFANKIDENIQLMSYGQTNGIPQGSSIMDFIAEIILGYADLQLTEKINSTIEDYYILRYRDDYRIFVNNPQDGEKIIKCLTEILIDLGLKLNPLKTIKSSDLIDATIKKDKLYWIEHEHKQKNNQKQLLLLYELSKKYPNSGTLKTQLTYYFKFFKLNNKDNIQILINIITQIAYNNPSVYPITAAILSKLLQGLKTKKERLKYLNKILKKFNKKPNTGFLQVWLQRISYKIKKSENYSENLCKCLDNKTSSGVWNFDWISDNKLLRILKSTSIINEEVVNNMEPEIRQDEVDLFKDNYETPLDFITLEGD